MSDLDKNTAKLDEIYQARMLRMRRRVKLPNIDELDPHAEKARQVELRRRGLARIARRLSSEVEEKSC